MATITVYSPTDRANLLNSAIERANQQLEAHRLTIKFVSQLPKKDEIPNPNSLDERPDIELAMCLKGSWVPIDMIYLRQMPQEPEKLRDLDELTKAIVEKALDHLKATEEPTVLITSSGTKYNLGHLKEHRLQIDPQEYLRLNGLRIVAKNAATKQYIPIKDSSLRSHTRTTPQELPDSIFNITDKFDETRTDGRQGMFCVTQRADSISLDRIIATRQAEAKEYSEKYVPLVRTWDEVKKLQEGTTDFFN